MRYLILFLCYCISILSLSCNTSKKTELLWKKDFYNIGSQSSPRMADLNGDGVFDIIMGAAKGENQPNDQGVLALNGTTGELLWQQKGIDQVFGSATFYDVTEDGVPDVFISGRSSILMALDGSNGRKIWEYEYQFENNPILNHARFNFYNTVLIPDQDQNGHPELLTVNGGNVEALPHEEENRFPGVLMVLDSKNGQIIAADTMPDGKESYMSPLYFEQPASKEKLVVFGSGGETISGHLYLAKLSDLMNGNLKNAQIIAREEGHGFIAPPVLVDLTDDGYYDIVAISHGSSIFAIDGKTKHILWKQKIDHTESSNGFAVGNFTGDKTPDLFTFVSKGIWPDNTGSVQVLLNGSDGEIVYLDSLGCTGFSSPVVFDLNDDGVDEAIISINEFDCSRGYMDNNYQNIENKLIAIDFNSRSVNPIDRATGFKNIFSTPWVSDLDNDGYLDIVYCQNYHHGTDLLSFRGMSIKRISTSLRLHKPIRWGGYLGSNGDGIYPIRKD